jgi:hypothetical protein
MRYHQHLFPWGKERKKRERKGSEEKRTGVDNALLSELVQETLGDLVSTVVLSDLLTKDEDGLVAGHLLLHRRVERLTAGHLCVDEEVISTVLERRGGLEKGGDAGSSS